MSEATVKVGDERAILIERSSDITARGESGEHPGMYYADVHCFGEFFKIYHRPDVRIRSGELLVIRCYRFWEGRSPRWEIVE